MAKDLAAAERDEDRRYGEIMSKDVMKFMKEEEAKKVMKKEKNETELRNIRNEIRDRRLRKVS
jgi:hypothetical protein